MIKASLVKRITQVTDGKMEHRNIYTLSALYHNVTNVTWM